MAARSTAWGSRKETRSISAEVAGTASRTGEKPAEWVNASCMGVTMVLPCGRRLVCASLVQGQLTDQVAEFQFGEDCPMR